VEDHAAHGNLGLEDFLQVPCNSFTFAVTIGCQVERVYFFELAIALSGYLNAVNPFNQPGVEAYKKNMFALLGKPGFEELGAELNARL